MSPQTAAAILDPARLAALEDTGLLESAREEDFDRLTRLAARMLGAESAAVSLIAADRQFLKSCVTGGADGELIQATQPLVDSYCKLTVGSREPVVIVDSHTDPLVRDRPIAAARSYIGIPLVLATGAVLGSLCVFDSRPRQWTVEETRILGELAGLVVCEIELRAEVRRRERVERELAQISTRDELTGLYNRRGLRILGEQLLAVARRTGQRVIVLCGDMNGFKEINDAFGHAAGDAALKGVAEVLKGALRETDVVARMGGDEFVVVALHDPATVGDELADLLAHRIHEGLARHNAGSGKPYELAMCVGWAEAAPSVPLDALVAEADEDLCSRKMIRRAGRAPVARAS